ncbi:TetR/AcrR family transcriptional regulator [Kibdelosporangium phytohabitans]|uniref:HTH tetR-type domain-containing protein n=1 Tax=Kibdelosporangium phytohabitans TaxID=860235 RepID=A0A0N9IC37_9PSEU|nr:TetR/AcrR family transcriptional regulator [Kibdelosporangium phytohabitans]ALG12249.1 hypothetical protein AOZ06_40135 [Kibdelosporangium phytohabitans]MBE1463794.1 AcrR family transcriptional regulator [Kibdelosporangium phytohabitans]
MTSPTHAVERADARRNRELVRRTAMKVFAENGMDVSLGRIARRAGVGAGTVYRHFPSKEILLEAVPAENIDRMVAVADRWAARAAPGDALFGFLVDVIETSAGRQPVCDALAADRGRPRATLTAAARRFREALDRLLSNAKQAGAIHVDVQADDLTALISGGAVLQTTHRSKARGGWLVRLLLDGLRTPVVTEPADFRDNRGHETTTHCIVCGTPLSLRTTGRPARYCGPTCRQRAQRGRVAS